MKGKMYSFLFYLVIFAWGVTIGRDSWRPEAIGMTMRQKVAVWWR